MIRKILLSITAIAMLASSTSAFALFDGEVRYGTRWYESETDGEKSGAAFDGLTLSGHLAVIPFVGAGVSVSQFNMKDRDLGDSLDSYTITEVGLDILINPPVPFLYGRLNLPVMSAGEMKGDGSSGVSETAAAGDFIASVGTEFSIIPMLSLTLEASHGVVMTKTTSVTVDGDETSLDNGAKANTLQSVMFGIRAGI